MAAKRILLAGIVFLVEAHLQHGLVTISITRHHKGDMFHTQGTKCYKDLCVGISSGTASATDPEECGCQCMPNLPIFRDDLNICVDDIHECSLASFVSGTTAQKIPFVFLPLKGQIVYPSAEINFSADASAPICVVSGAQYLGRGGWVDLRNNSDADTEPPFRLFRDEGRTYLQWLGEADLRTSMEGRLILVHLMCKDAGGSEQHKIFTPCVAFRVAGNPSVREMMFASDVQSTQESEGGLSVSEYIAISICSILLALIYVASVFLYLHMRKRKLKETKDKDTEGGQLTVGEEGVVKSNPLLQATRRHLAAVAGANPGQDNVGYSSDSGSCCSESDAGSDHVCQEDDDEVTAPQNMQISALVHPYDAEYNLPEPMLNQEPNNIERLPEEDVSIVETLEGREERPETVRAMGNGNVRRKLYFNPAYFELDLLKTPPPAALEFLTKIREVISIAKHKMSAKRFCPSLLGIPEEELYARGVAAQRKAASLASHNSGGSGGKRNRKKTCPGCAESEVIEEEPINFNTAASGSCCPSDTKQRIIRKWLEDVPILKMSRDQPADSGSYKRQEGSDKIQEERPSSQNRCKSPTEKERNKPPPPPARNETKRPSTKGPAPPRPPPPNNKAIKPAVDMSKAEEAEKFERREFPSFSTFSNFSFFSSSFKSSRNSDQPPPVPKSNPGPLPSSVSKQCVTPPPRVKSPPCPPPLPPTPVNEEDPDTVPRVQGKDKVPPVVAKTLMDAVIQELVVQRKGEPKKKPTSKVHDIALKLSEAAATRNKNSTEQTASEKFQFEADSLERKTLVEKRVGEMLEFSISKGNKTIQESSSEVKQEFFLHSKADKRSGDMIDQIDSCIRIFGDKNDQPHSCVDEDDEIEEEEDGVDEEEECEAVDTKPGKERKHSGSHDDHDYEVILLNPESGATVQEEDADKDLKIYNLPEIMSKNERSEGYSLVSEVYVNDGYTYSSGGSSPSTTSQSSKDQPKKHSTGDKSGRLTIQVKDSPDNYKHVINEADVFEPDTLDRKPHKMKIVGTHWEDCGVENYSNQKFHDQDLDAPPPSEESYYNNGNEHFMDSLERPHIMLKSNGSFRKSTLERNVNELFRNLEPQLSKHCGSLREIYEAKSKHHRRRTETTSLVGSVTSDTDCQSTLSWSEDRRNKLLHRGIVIHHLGSGDGRKHRRSHKMSSNRIKMNYPDVVPPRPPKPPSLCASPAQRSACTTPGNRSYCPSPCRSVCASPPPRSFCTSPQPRSINASPPPRSVCPSPPPRPCTTPPRSVCASPTPRSGCASPTPRSGRNSPSPRSGRNSPMSISACTSPPPRSACTSPPLRGMCATSPFTTPCRSICASPTPPPRSACTSPLPPPRPPNKPQDHSPPLPPRNLKPPLPPKNAKSTRQRKVSGGLGSSGCNPARRPLPPLPSPRHYHDSTISSVSSRDLETLSTLSGASMDSLNSSDYEAFYTLPYDGNEGEIYDKAQDRLVKSYNIYNDPPASSNRNSDNVFSTDEDIYNAMTPPIYMRNKGKESVRHLRSRRTVDSVKRSWRKIVEKNGLPHKPEDSGYLSTDSNDSNVRSKMLRGATVTKIPERVETPGSQGSETEESYCDGASESGAESIATDSFFFGNFRKLTAVESLDSGVGSDVAKRYNHSFRLSDVEVNSDTERHCLPIMVRP